MTGRLILPALAVAAIAAIPVLAPTLQVLMTLALCKGIAVLGVTVLLRAGQVSFGHALFFAVAAYAGAFASAAALDDLALLVVAGVAVGALTGLLVGLFVSRYRGIFFGMLNLAFSMIFWSILEKFYHLTGGADGLRLPRPTVLGIAMERGPFEDVLFYLVLACALGTGWFVLRFLASPVGQLYQTIKTNETRLEYLGVSPRGTLLKGYVLSAALCSLGGVLMAVAQGIVTPEYAYWVRSGEMVFIAVLGGAGSVPGAFAGAVAYEVVRSYASAFAADVWQLVLGAFLLVIVLFAPGGLVGIYGALADRVARRKRGGAGPAARRERDA
jgi:branched-chain amino acid transport system permease protein